MASTISRTVRTDDSGTPANPVGDGTTLNNAELQATYDAIDAMFAGALTLGGNLTLEGGNLSVTGTAAISSNATVGGTLGVTGNTTLTGLTSTGGITVASVVPIYAFNETDGATDAKIWRWQVDGGVLRLFILNDAQSANQVALSVARTANAVTSVSFATNNITRLTIDNAAITPAVRINSGSAQPGFLAYNSSNDVSIGTGTGVEFNTEVYDNAGNFASNTFTAPVTGTYLFTVIVSTSANTNTALQTIQLVTTARTYESRELPNANSVEVTLKLSVLADMSAGQTASVNFVVAAGTVTIQGGAPLKTYFSGRLMP